MSQRTSETDLQHDLASLLTLRNHLALGSVPTDDQLASVGFTLAQTTHGWVCLHALGEGFLHGPARPHDTRRGALQQALTWRMRCIADHLRMFQDEDDQARERRRQWN